MLQLKKGFVGLLWILPTLLLEYEKEIMCVYDINLVYISSVLGYSTGLDVTICV